MKLSKLVLALALASVGVVQASVNVMDVKVQPRSPWTGLVDVEYTVVCEDADSDIYVNPVGYDGDRRITLFPSSFTGDGAEGPVKPGKHTMVWDAKKDFGHLFSCANFQLKIHAGKRLPRYAVIDLSEGANATNYPVHFSVIGPNLSNDVCRTTELWLRLVPPGEFWMGSPADELGREDNEDLHHVTLTKPFYIGVFEVTQKQHELVMGTKPAYFNSAENSDVRPVEQINSQIRGNFTSFSPRSSTIEPNSFCGRIRSKTILSLMDLPSETRWEYACRAGTMTALYNGRNLSSTTADEGLSAIAGYEANCHNNQGYDHGSILVGTRKVGSFAPNALGLYDLLGNVSEWCLDGYHSSRNGSSHVHWGFDNVTDPETWDAGWDYGNSSKVIRGGGWRQWASDVRAGRRRDLSYTTANDVGFRVCSEIGF